MLRFASVPCTRSPLKMTPAVVEVPSNCIAAVGRPGSVRRTRRRRTLRVRADARIGNTEHSAPTVNHCRLPLLHIWIQPLAWVKDQQLSGIASVSNMSDVTTLLDALVNAHDHHPKSCLRSSERRPLDRLHIQTSLIGTPTESCDTALNFCMGSVAPFAGSSYGDSSDGNY